MIGAMEISRGILVLNGGSSSIKAALFGVRPGDVVRTTLGHGPDALAALFAWIDREGAAVQAVGHRIVFGGETYGDPCLLTDAVLAELRALAPYDPEHLPLELELVDRIRERHPQLPQIACFDTSFHRTLPMVARMLPLPRRLYARGVRRYGFHGLSYQFVMREIEREAGAQAARGRLVLAHLGNGASLTAVRDGKSVDTTMGFSPSGGVPMSSRAGDVDPGVIAFLARSEGMPAERFAEMATKESGLLGISETSGDLRALAARSPSDPRAAEAIALFCYEVKKRIGAFAAALGGLDRLVFTGGIGEHAADVRARVCEGLDFLGVTLDARLNADHARVISRAGAGVTVQVIATDEEQIIAEGVLSLLAASS